MSSAPFRRITKAVFEHRVFRCNFRDKPRRKLRIFHVCAHLLVEIVHVITIEDSGAHQMCLLQPAQLLAVRAIGEHTLHIALDGDIDEPVNLIEERIARLKYASRRAEEWMKMPVTFSTRGSVVDPGAGTTCACT